MAPLTEKICKPCEGGILPLSESEVKDYISQLGEGWEVVDGARINKQYAFADFKEAMEFVNRVAELAEREQHHPNIRIVYNKVGIELTTHVIHGLSENDFILAAKIDQLTEQE